MAKTSKIVKNAQRRKLVAKHAEERARLVAIIKDADASFDDKWDAQRKLAKMPRDASPTRIRNRCALTGRPRGYYRKFGLSRIALRDEGLLGNIPGLVKASW